MLSGKHRYVDTHEHKTCLELINVEKKYFTSKWVGKEENICHNIDNEQLPSHTYLDCIKNYAWIWTSCFIHGFVKQNHSFI